MAAQRAAGRESKVRGHLDRDEIPWIVGAPERRGGERYVASWRGVEMEVQADLTGPWPLRSPWIWTVLFRTPGPEASAAEGLADGLEEAKAKAEAFARACLLDERTSSRDP